jgi:hypothetical protein
MIRVQHPIEGSTHVFATARNQLHLWFVANHAFFEGLDIHFRALARI